MIGLLYSKDLGEVVGDIEPDVNSRKYIVKFPHRIHMTENGPVIMNILGLVQENEIELEASSLVTTKIYKLDPTLEKEVSNIINPNKKELLLPDNKLKL